MVEAKAKERPVLFNGEMVRAILEGRKTQTRRPVVAGATQTWLTPDLIRSVPHGKMYADRGLWHMHHPAAGTRHMGVDVEHDSPLGCVKSPFGVPGDLLYVRETHHLGSNGSVRYRADYGEWDPFDADLCGDDCSMVGEKWLPSIHMKREHSRITLRVLDVRVERVQEIDAEGAWEEGFREHDDGSLLEEESVDAFRWTWDAIYAAKGLGWDANPWVWVCEFEKVEVML